MVEINILENPINIILSEYFLYGTNSSNRNRIRKTNNDIVKLIGFAYDKNVYTGLCFIYVIFEKDIFCLDTVNVFNNFFKFNSKYNICLTNDCLSDNFLKNTYKYLLKGVSIGSCQTIDSYFIKLYHSKTIFDEIKGSDLYDS